MTRPALRLIKDQAPFRCVDPSARGYAPLWQSGCACPGCHRRHWLVGRFSAECAFCGTALPIGGRDDQ